MPWPPLGERQATTLAERFARQVAATPGATAVIEGDTRVTYEELAQRAGRLASRLAELGVGPEVRVGLFLPRSLDLVVATLAVVQAGGAFITLDPSYPQDRLAYMLADSAARVLIAPREPGRRCPGWRRRSSWSRPTPAPPKKAPPCRPVPCHAAQPGLRIYTSGSTGRPKGVAIENRSTVALLEWAERTFAGDLAGVAGEAAVSFDVWMFELFAPLTTGGTLVVLDTLLSLPDHPAAAEVTLVSAVPAVMAELLRDRDLPPSVRTVVLGGEILPRALADRVYAQSPAERVVNAYGPTEDTTYSTTSVVPRIGAEAPRIGRPITGGRGLLLGTDLELAPLGAPAELFLGGEGLARGYFGRPNLTAERFVPNPFSGEPGERLYRTGDLARFLPSGELEYLGRIDQQIKLRGFRIELSEIEEVLKGHPGVWQSAVVLTEGADGDAAKRRLVAFFAPNSGVTIEPAELSAYLKERLPAPMLPSALLALDELPLSPNGKVDRRALARQAEESAGTTEFVAPRNAVEEKLSRIWSELLGAERISVTDDFFVLGGHSLLATQLASRLKKELGLEIPIASLFELRTLEDQAREILRSSSPVTRKARSTTSWTSWKDSPRKRSCAAGGGRGRDALAPWTSSRASSVSPAAQKLLLARLRKKEEADAIPPSPRRATGEPFPLSFPQQRLWFLARLDPDNPSYNVNDALHVEGPLEVPALEAALAALVARHEALRTRFFEVDATPWQEPLARSRPPAAGRSGRPAAHPSGAGDLAPGRVVRGRAVRSRPRPPSARPPRPAAGGAAPPAGLDPPHRLGRLVDDPLPARACPSLRRGRRRPPFRSAAAPHPVRRLCRLAEPPARRRDARPAAGEIQGAHRGGAHRP